MHFPKPKFNSTWVFLALGAGALAYFYRDKLGFLKGGGKQDFAFEPGVIDQDEYGNTVPFPNYKPIQQALTDCLSSAENDVRAQPNCIKLANRAIAMATYSQSKYQSNSGGKNSWSNRWGGGRHSRPSKPKPKPRYSSGRGDGCLRVGSIQICRGCIRVGNMKIGCKGGGYSYPSPRPSSKYKWWKHGRHYGSHYWSHDNRWWWDDRGRRWRGHNERDDDHRGGKPSPHQQTKNYYERYQKRASDETIARQYGLTPYKNDYGIQYMRGLYGKLHVA